MSKNNSKWVVIGDKQKMFNINHIINFKRVFIKDERMPEHDVDRLFIVTLGSNYEKHTINYHKVFEFKGKDSHDQMHEKMKAIKDYFNPKCIV